MLAAGDVDVRGVDCKCVAPLGECVPPEDPNKLCRSLFLIRTKTLEPAAEQKTAEQDFAKYCRANPKDTKCSILTLDLDEKRSVILRGRKPGDAPAKKKIGSQNYHEPKL